MPFDVSLAARIRDALARRKGIDERKMFGGICFLLHGNLLVGVWKDSLIARLGPDVKLAYCPMADKPWLQKDKDIKNPYYGSAMLTCGSFK